MDGAKSETASPFVTQVPSIPRDQADQLTRPQSTPEPSERWMSGRVDGWIEVVVGVSYGYGYSKSLVFLKCLVRQKERRETYIQQIYPSPEREYFAC